MSFQFRLRPRRELDLTNYFPYFHESLEKKEICLRNQISKGFTFDSLLVKAVPVS